jgi:hypothetical protein
VSVGLLRTVSWPRGSRGRVTCIVSPTSKFRRQRPICLPDLLDHHSAGPDTTEVCRRPKGNEYMYRQASKIMRALKNPGPRYSLNCCQLECGMRAAHELGVARGHDAAVLLHGGLFAVARRSVDACGARD